MDTISGLSSQYVNNSRKIDNFVRAVEAATDIKGENLAIERELAQSSSVRSLPSSSDDHQVHGLSNDFLTDQINLQDNSATPTKRKFPLILIFMIIFIFVFVILSFFVVQYIG